MGQISNFDVIVVGCGIAGLSAAVSALQDGATVCVVERAPIEQRGGNTRHTGAYLRMKDIDHVSDDFEEHFAANAGGYVDPSLLHEMSAAPESWPSILRSMSVVDPNVVGTLATEAPPTLHWLTTFGIKFIPLEVPFPTSVQPRIVPSGGGLALVEGLAAYFEEHGGTILYETTARKLLQDEDGAITGVAAVRRGGKPVRLTGRSVILASGGFQGNAEMLARYLGPRAAYLRTMSVGCHYNKGEGIQMALDIGAAVCGDFGSWHASPMDPRSDRAGPSLYIYPYGILVNKRGVRFVDEAPGPTDETYERVTREIFAQPEGMGYIILDAKSLNLSTMAAAVRTEKPAIEASSVEELATKLEIPAETLVSTVSAYNAACPGTKSDPMIVDDVATKGVVPQKSNWAVPIDQAPYRAYPVISSIVFTFGGLKVNTKAQVLNTDGDAIPGLYASGELMGLYYGNYTGASSVLKGAVFGRIAGKDASERARSNTGALTDEPVSA